MRIGILRYAYLQIGVSSRAAMALLLGSTKKEQGPPALTATQPATGSLRRQWPRAFRDDEAERLAVLIDHGRVLHQQIGWFLRHCFCLKGSDRQALDLVDRLEWCKTNKNKPGFWMGSGYTTRKNFEVAWLGRIGQPRRADKGVPALIVAPRREHSRKPDEQYERIERFVGPGKILVELFARQCRPGWHAWGDQLDRFAPNLETSPARRRGATCDEQLEFLFAAPVAPVPIEDDPLEIPEFLRRTPCARSAKIEIAIEEVVEQ
jgi:N6-adenosine-specific RNA methylase IME4